PRRVARVGPPERGPPRGGLRGLPLPRRGPGRRGDDGDPRPHQVAPATPMTTPHSFLGRLGLGLVALLAAAPASGQSGTAAAEFLNVPVGARATAMGGAFGATASDGTALYLNPAGLGALDGPTATFEYAQWYVGSDFNFASVAAPTAFGTVAV